MDESDQNGDRRRTQRIPINDEFAELGGDGGSSWVSDLSATGVFVHSTELLEIGSSIELRFTVITDDLFVIDAIGKIVRHSEHPHGMGVVFTDIQPEMAERIEAVLDHRQPIDSGAPLRAAKPGRRLARPAPVELGRELVESQPGSSSQSGDGFESAVTGTFRTLNDSLDSKPDPSSGSDSEWRAGGSSGAGTSRSGRGPVFFRSRASKASGDEDSTRQFEAVEPSDR